MTQLKQRSSYWDNIKGILIFLTVFAHVLYQLQSKSNIINSTVDYIYMFHMPAFIFVSGYFGKSKHSHSAESIIKLIFLYFVFNSIMGFIYGCDNLLFPMYSYWYLLAIVAWRITTPHIAKFKEIVLILFVIAIFAGFFPSIDNSFAAARIIAFYPFYMMGYLLSEEKSAELSEKKYSKRLTIGLLTALITAIIAFAAYQFFKYDDRVLLMSYYGFEIEVFGRIVLYIIAFGALYALRCITPNKKIPLLTLLGKNSLWIFILHRPFTLIISDLIKDMSIGVIFIIAIISSIAICLAFGNNFVVKYMNKFADDGTAIFTSSEHTKFNFAKLTAICVSLGFIVSIVLNAYDGFSIDDFNNIANNKTSDEMLIESGNDTSYAVMSAQQKENFDNAFRITFSGDLILLEDQVKRAYNGSTYDFSDVFEYACKYISSADYAIGVFEGPMASEETGYSSSNFGDNKELYLNFPDEFADAVKNAGFDLVSTATNHVLDKGEKGAIRTLDILDNIGLDHTGSYRTLNEKQNQHIKLIECDGIKMAVLSYTYGSNYTDNSRLIDGDLSHITSIISGTDGELFEKLKADVVQDFNDAKALSPDLIIVLPHIGTQFKTEPDAEQEVWFNIFKENGADIILGDHSHAVQPAFIDEYNGRNVFTAYCPGNFANIYRKNLGDTSMLVDVYIDRDTKKVIGGGIVPLYTHARADGNYRAVPIYDIMNDDALRAQLSTDDIECANSANRLATKVVFGEEMDITSVTERYYFDKNGFLRSKISGLELTDEMKNGVLYKAMEKAETICFIGDSVTEGTKNNGCPWYEPIEEHFSGKNISNYSKGGCTVSYMTKNIDKIPAADLYVIAIGTNDVRYRDESLCAMTADDYTAEIGNLVNMLYDTNSACEFVFIAPWYSTDGDQFCKLSFSEKTSLNNEYSDKLGTYCRENNFGYINANGYIKNMLDVNPQSKYLLDHIHPNASEGVLMYSQAVLLQDEK